MISIVSIPHTGTKFTEKVLMALGQDVRHAHLHSEHPLQDARAWISSGDTVVIPWRDMGLAQQSAVARGEKPRPLSEFVELLGLTDLPNVHLFVVDTDNQDREMEKLCAFLDVAKPAHTDWTPVNMFKGH